MSHHGYGLLFFVALCLSTGCQENKEQQPVVRKKEKEDLGTIAALPLEVRAPANNPVTPEKVELGRFLFYDPILSGRKDVSCASCHHPEFGYAENIDISIGVNGRGLGLKRAFKEPNDIPFTKRNSPTLLNVAFNGIDASGNYDPEQAPMFWDLREKSLEAQSLHPIRSMEEMRGREKEEAFAVEAVISRLKGIPAYRSLFSKAFPEGQSISEENLGKALASFQRILIANQSRFDQYMRGDTKALSRTEIEGMQLFLKTGCARCHRGPMLSDFKVHVLGIADNEKLGKPDSGYNGSFAFRTPTLRNLRFTQPYMHSGKIATLEHVLTFYEDLQGHELPNKKVSKDQLDPLAKKLKVEFRDISKIIQFLNTLNDPVYDKKIPEKVPSGLAVGGLIE